MLYYNDTLCDMTWNIRSLANGSVTEVPFISGVIGIISAKVGLEGLFRYIVKIL
jgi:hypothetical protein